MFFARPESSTIEVLLPIGESPLTDVVIHYMITALGILALVDQQSFVVLLIVLEPELSFVLIDESLSVELKKSGHHHFRKIHLDNFSHSFLVGRHIDFGGPRPLWKIGSTPFVWPSSCPCAS